MEERMNTEMEASTLNRVVTKALLQDSLFVGNGALTFSRFHLNHQLGVSVNRGPQT